MNKLLSCRYNTDSNRVEARFEDGSILAIDCTAIEDEYGNTPAQRAELDWLLHNKPLEYTQMVLRGRWSITCRWGVTTAGWRIDLRDRTVDCTRAFAVRSFQRKFRRTHVLS